MDRVFIIEDDRVVARVYQANLQAAGIEVACAHDGEEGLRHVEEWEPDIIVLDLGLPKLSGVDVIKRIRASSCSATPIVVLTNSYVTETVQAAWKAGASKCLTKSSCSAAQLTQIIQGMLVARRAPAKIPMPASIPAPVAAPAAATATATAEMAQLNSPEKLREEFLKDAPGRIIEMRQRFLSVTRAGSQAQAELVQFYRMVHSLAGTAGIAGFLDIAQLAAAIEALVKELHDNPKKLGPSPIRTIATAIDSLSERLKTASAAEEEEPYTPLILVVDDDRISRTMIGTALTGAKLRHVLMSDPKVALSCASENAFDLLFTDVRMPTMTGFELCATLRSLPLHLETPVIFVTAADDFESKAQSKLSGGTDLIGKPFLMSELAVKALTYLKRPV